MGDGHDTIYLDGLGGNFFAGHFETRVKGTSASMCAYVWLAGSPRARGQGSGIGFHAVFAKDTLQETGGPNAVLGSYLTKLGMSYQAIGYMTAKHATEMQWLTPEDAQTLGINVVMLDEITNPSPPPQTTAPAASLPEIHIPPLAVRRKAHPDWKPLGSETKEFTEIQESCKSYPADQVSLCWWQERDSWDWSVKNREKFPKDKFPEAQAKLFQC